MMSLPAVEQRMHMSRKRLQRHIQVISSAAILCKGHILQYACALYASKAHVHLPTAHASLARQVDSCNVWV